VAAPSIAPCRHRFVRILTADLFPTSLGTLDALHLATALAIRDELPSMAFATHDRSLANAATAVGYEVHGLT
jgi:predicted nucleic acid-binding protein